MKGQLFYLIGASGAGKDTIINYARSVLADNTTPVGFAQRYITRPPAPGTEAFVSVTKDEFQQLSHEGRFALQWQAHGLHYGIDVQINRWLEQGVNVVLNGSRAYLDKARRQYPNIVPVLVETPLDVLANRLKDRGRESGQQIALRLQRAKEFMPLRIKDFVKIDNSGTIEKAGNQLIHIVSNKITS